MRYVWRIGLVALLGFFVAGAIHAIGNGPGGTPPDTCSKDTWTCDDWDVCGLDGAQERSCSLTKNCPTVEDPSPSESRSCTPECTNDTWTCGAWSTCTLGGEQTRTCTLTDDCPLTSDASPITSQACQPSCTGDTWTCADWGACSSGGVQTRACTLTQDCTLTEDATPSEVQSCAPPQRANTTPTTNSSVTPATSSCTKHSWECGDWGQCQENGHQSRACTRTSDCSSADTESPETDRACEGLRCGHLEPLSERVSCRLALTTDEAATENNILYFPEYCKTEESHEEKLECIALYQSFGPCWNVSSSERQSCAREVMALKSPSEERVACLAAGPARAACGDMLKEKVKQQMLFALYELEFQSEQLMEVGRLNQDQVVALEVYIEQQKQRIEHAPTVAEWKTLVTETKIYWENLMSGL